MTRRLTRAKTKIADGRHPVPGADRAGAGRAAAGRPGRAVPALHPGLRRRRRAGLRRRGDPAGPAARPADAGAARGGRRCWRCSCCSDSRRAARRDADGNLLTLDEQDRARWDHAAIAEGSVAAGPGRADGPYALQARIAACHATAPSAADTDWPADRRMRTTSSCRLQPDPGDRAQPGGGARLRVRARRPGWRCSPRPARAARSTATRWRWPREAELTARHGDRARAAALFRAAAAMVSSTAERTALVRRADDLTAGGP